MGLFEIPKDTLPGSADLKNIAARYRHLRAIRFRLNQELVRRLSRDVLEEGAKRLGMLRKGVFFFDNEDQSSVLMDYCIYDVHRRGRNAVEQYLCDMPPEAESDEMICLRAMQHATYAMVAVLRIEPGVGCHIRNLFTDETRLLVDFGFAASARPGALMATRLLDFGEFVTTSGAALPIGVLDSEELEEWQRRISEGVNVPDFDPAQMIRECLERGASSYVRYEEPGGDHRISAGRPFQASGAPSEIGRERAKSFSVQPAENRRCRCGSGKMFKNCCGKRSAPQV